MNNLCAKLYTLMFVFLNVALLHSMEQSIKSPIDEQDTSKATTRVSTVVPVQKCVLDFTKGKAFLSSTFQITRYLLTESFREKLNLVDFTYLTLEAVAAGARANPGGFGKLVPFFNEEDVVYNAFKNIFHIIDSTDHELSILAEHATCHTFVHNAIAVALPLLLNNMGAIPDVIGDIKCLATVFTPMFSGLLHKSYNGLFVAAHAASTVLHKVEEEVAEVSSILSFCGCGKRK